MTRGPFTRRSTGRPVGTCRSSPGAVATTSHGRSMRSPSLNTSAKTLTEDSSLVLILSGALPRHLAGLGPADPKDDHRNGDKLFEIHENYYDPCGSQKALGFLGDCLFCLYFYDAQLPKVSTGDLSFSP